MNMDLNDFIAKFASQFDDTDVSEFKADTEFKTLDEWSSLLSMSITAMADEEYNAVLKGEDIKNAVTIQDLFEIIKAKG